MAPSVPVRPDAPAERPGATRRAPAASVAVTEEDV